MRTNDVLRLSGLTNARLQTRIEKVRWADTQVRPYKGHGNKRSLAK